MHIRQLIEKTKQEIENLRRDTIILSNAAGGMMVEKEEHLRGLEQILGSIALYSLVAAPPLPGRATTREAIPEGIQEAIPEHTQDIKQEAPSDATPAQSNTHDQPASSSANGPTSDQGGNVEQTEKRGEKRSNDDDPNSEDESDDRAPKRLKAGREG